MKLLTQAFEPIDTNSYLLLDPISHEAIWIDPAPGSASWVDEKLPETFFLKAILCTHSHWDHIASIGENARFDKVPVFVHTLDANNLTDPGSDGLAWPPGIRKPKAQNLLTWKEGDSWQLGAYHFDVWPTPGHSPGSVCFFNSEKRWLFSGDTLFGFGYGRVDLPTGNPKAMLASLKRLCQLPSNTLIFPGHGSSCAIEKMDWLRQMTRD